MRKKPTPAPISNPNPPPDPCLCCDFEPVDPDDSLCFECVCGHVVDEHRTGFLRSCIFNPEE